MLTKSVENTAHKYLNNHKISFFLLPKVRVIIKDFEQMLISELTSNVLVV